MNQLKFYTITVQKSGSTHFKHVMLQHDHKYNTIVVWKVRNKAQCPVSMQSKRFDGAFDCSHLMQNIPNQSITMQPYMIFQHLKFPSNYDHELPRHFCIQFHSINNTSYSGDDLLQLHFALEV
jgi:hypothetical protein